MWVTKHLISPVKLRIFAQERPNLARNWHFCQALPAHLVPCWWVDVGCGVRAVSRKTPIYFIINNREMKYFFLHLPTFTMNGITCLPFSKQVQYNLVTRPLSYKTFI